MWIILRQRHQEPPEPQLLPDEDIQKCQLEPSNPGLLQPPWNIDLGDGGGHNNNNNGCENNNKQ